MCRRLRLPRTYDERTTLAGNRCFSAVVRPGRSDERNCGAADGRRHPAVGPAVLPYCCRRRRRPPPLTPGNRFRTTVGTPHTAVKTYSVFGCFFFHLDLFLVKKGGGGHAAEGHAARQPAGRPAGESTVATRGPVVRPTDTDAPAGRLRRAQPPPYRFRSPVSGRRWQSVVVTAAAAVVVAHPVWRSLRRAGTEST